MSKQSFWELTCPAPTWDNCSLLPLIANRMASPIDSSRALRQDRENGEAMMDDSEIPGRIALLEALVFGLLEIKVIETGNAGGEDAVNNLVRALGEIVGQRLDGMPKEQADFARTQFGANLQALEARLLPRSRGEPLN